MRYCYNVQLEVYKMNTTSVKRSKVKDMVYISMSAVLIAICSWISIPGPVPFTLQTMAVFLVIGILGGKRGTISVLLYILLGMAGVPVFAGFKGGIGVLLGTTGGYIFGFLFSALLMWGIEKIWGNGKWVRLISMVAGLIACYISGTVWFMMVYTKTTGPVGAGAVLGWCVIPFIIPDCIKTGLAFVLTGKLKKFID